MEPFIDFKSFEELPDGLEPDVLNDEKIQTFIKSQFDKSFENRFDIEASGLKMTNAQIKEEKAKLQEYLDKYKGVDLEEYDLLKQFRENNGDAGKQLASLQAEKEVLRAERDGIADSFKSKIQLLEDANKVNQQQLTIERLNNQVASGIREHNSKHPAVSIKPGMERWLIEEASRVFVPDEKGSFTPMNGDRVLTGPEGNVMNYAEWVNHQRTKPDFQAMFNEPVGGGATGGGTRNGRLPNKTDLAGTTAERRNYFREKFNLTE